MSLRPQQVGRRGDRGFSLLELIVSIAVLALIMVVVFEIVGATRNAFSQSRAKTSQFRTARTAFEAMSRRVGQAVLNTYWDYDDPETPQRYQRQSELHFVAGPTGTSNGLIPELLGGGAERPAHGIFFQGPFSHSSDPGTRSLDSLLNSWGYYIQFGSDEEYLPPFMRGRPGVEGRLRFRLMEFRPTTEKMQVYRDALKDQGQGFDFFRWFRDPIDSGEDHSRPIAENVVALVISPRRSRNDAPLDPGNDVAWDIAPNYYFDTREFQRSPAVADDRIEHSKHQLPPLLQITMVTIDEASATRLAIQSGDSVPDLQLGNLFQEVGRYDEDLEALEATLRDRNLNHQVFATTVIMRAAKWSDIPEDSP